MHCKPAGTAVASMSTKAAVVEQIFASSIAAKTASAQALSAAIAEAAGLLVSSLRQGGKILTCGNGGSAADAQHFSSEMLNRFERDRAGFAAIALTTDASTLTSRDHLWVNRIEVARPRLPGMREGEAERG